MKKSIKNISKGILVAVLSLSLAGCEGCSIEGSTTMHKYTLKFGVISEETTS